jgi:hypothetical protein
MYVTLYNYNKAWSSDSYTEEINTKHKKEGFTDMMRIRVFTDWGTPESIRNMIETEFSLHIVPGYKKTFELTSGDDYTHAFVINTYMPSLFIPKEFVVGLAWEPPSDRLLPINSVFINYVQQNMCRYLLGSKKGLPEPFEESYAFLNHNPLQDSIPHKTKRCSMIFSQKGFMEGHIYRNDLVHAILKTDLPIDIWGRGCSTVPSDPRLRGEFVQDSVLPYQDYQFHICIENHYSDHYFSEKIVNALLSECTPIYYGCRKINDYFPEQILSLIGNVKDDIDRIKEFLSYPDKYQKQIDSKRVHETTNPFCQLKKLFKL